MKARDVMSSPVISLRAQEPVRTAAALLMSHGFSGAPVIGGDEHVIGVVTEADLVRFRIVPDGWTVEEYAEPTVAGVMTDVPVVAGPDDDLADVVAVMLDNGFRSIPIVDDGRLVGVVSRRDVLRLVARGELTSDDVWRRRHGMASRDRATG